MTADIKPVAWVSNRDPMFGDGWGATSPIVYSDPGAHAAPSGELVPLYPQSAIDSLQVMLDDAHADFKEMERLAHMHKARAERAEAEVEALRALLLEACDDGDEADADLLATLERARTAEARAERLAEALRWYAEQAELCRKLGAAGDSGRRALDADGGKRARAALRDHDRGAG